MTDRELDSAVAQAMGWAPRYQIDGRPGEQCPTYSTDLNAAFEFVEWMRAERCKELCLCCNNRGGWFAEFVDTIKSDDGRADDPAPARAICLAGLAALRGTA